MFRKLLAMLGSAALGFALSVAATAAPQDPPSDDALDRLLEKAQDAKKPEAAPAPDKPGEAAPDGQAKPEADKPATKKPASDEPEDKALDDLLEKLGQREDRPETKGRPAPPPVAGPEEKKAAAPPDDPSARDLDPAQKKVDEHLESILGRRRRRPPQEGGEQGKNQQKSDPSESDSELARTIKKMREVEQRLGQEDTGEQTRQKQEEIVKDLEQLIKLARQMSQSRQRGNQRQRPGQQQDQPNNPNDPQQGTNAMKPKKPTASEALAEHKDIWGELPPAMRAELENVFKEEALPGRRSLIDRYYLSIARKSAANRGN